MMFTISPLLAIVALTTVPVSVFGMRHRRRPRPAHASSRSGGAPALLNAQIEETFTGHAIVKAFGRQREVEERFRDTNDELYESSFGAQFMSSLMQPLTMFLGNVQYVIVAVVGGLRVASGAITRRRRAGVHPVLAHVLDAAHAARVDDERVPVGHRVARARARVPRRRGAEPDDPPAESPRRPCGAGSSSDDVTFSYDPDRPLIESLVAGRRAGPDRSPSSARPAPARPRSST